MLTFGIHTGLGASKEGVPFRFSSMAASQSAITSVANCRRSAIRFRSADKLQQKSSGITVSSFGGDVRYQKFDQLLYFDV